MSTKKVILAGLAAAAVCSFTAREADAQGLGAAIGSSFQYGCNDATYGANGSFWNAANGWTGATTQLVTYATPTPASSAGRGRSLSTTTNAGAIQGTFIITRPGNNGRLHYVAPRSTYLMGCGPGDTRSTSGSVVTASQTLRAAVAQTFSIIDARVSTARQAMRGDKDVTLQAFNLNGTDNGRLGLAGGNAAKGVGVWGQVQYTSVENDHASTAFDGYILTGVVGVDKALMKNRVLAGLSAGYEMGNFDTKFNSGTVETANFLVAPYVSFVPNDTISVDVTGGAAFGDVETTRTDPNLATQKYKGETDAMRWFGSFRVNAEKQRKKLRFGGSVGANYMTETRDAYTESAGAGVSNEVGETSTRLGQAVVGGKIGYDAGKVQPYARAQFEYDFTKSKAAQVGAGQTQPKESDYGLRLGGGLNIAPKPGMTIGIEGNTVLLRENYTEYSGLARVRFEF